MNSMVVLVEGVSLDNYPPNFSLQFFLIQDECTYFWSPISSQVFLLGRDLVKHDFHQQSWGSATWNREIARLDFWSLVSPCCTMFLACFLFFFGKTDETISLPMILVLKNMGVGWWEWWWMVGERFKADSFVFFQVPFKKGKVFVAFFSWFEDMTKS